MNLRLGSLLETDGQIQLSGGSDQMFVTRRWGSRGHAVALVIGLVFAAIAVDSAWLQIGAGPIPANSKRWWVFAVFAFVALYGSLTYWNRTEIRISSAGVEVHKGPVPIPWGRARKFGPLKSVSTRFDRSTTWRGQVVSVHVVEATRQSGGSAVLELLADKDEAKAMVRFLRRALREVR